MRRDSFAARCHRDEGSWADRFKSVCSRHRGDLRKQITQLLKEQPIPPATGRRRAKGSEGRASAIFRDLQQLVTILQTLGIAPRALNEVKLDDVLSYVHYQVTRGLKASTIRNRLSSLRRFATLCGVRHIVPEGEELTALLLDRDIDLAPRSRFDNRIRAWELTCEVNVMLQRIQQSDAHLSMLCELAHRFGMRLSEALRFEPAAKAFPNHIIIDKGAKNNRERLVPLSKDSEKRAVQQELLERCRIAAKQTPKGHLGFPGLSLKQSRQRAHDGLRAMGLCGSRLGLDFHGLRAQYGFDRFAELTGLPAPLKRAACAGRYLAKMKLVSQAAQTISEELGHYRRDVGYVYTGSVQMLIREEKAAARAADQLRQIAPELEQLGVSGAQIVAVSDGHGSFALSVVLEGSDPSRSAWNPRAAELVRHALRKKGIHFLETQSFHPERVKRVVFTPIASTPEDVLRTTNEVSLSGEVTA